MFEYCVPIVVLKASCFLILVGLPICRLSSLKVLRMHFLRISSSLLQGLSFSSSNLMVKLILNIYPIEYLKRIITNFGIRFNSLTDCQH